jgi:hypothetical protein
MTYLASLQMCLNNLIRVQLHVVALRVDGGQVYLAVFRRRER